MEPAGTTPNHHTTPPQQQSDVDEVSKNRSSLAALSKAGGDFDRHIGRPHRLRPVRVLPALAIAVLATAAVTISEGFHYRCTARIRIPQADTAENLGYFRGEMIAHVISQVDSLEDRRMRSWSVDRPSDSELKISLLAPSPEKGSAALRRLIKGYQSRLHTHDSKTRNTPSLAENLASQSIERIRTQLADAQTQVDTALLAIPETDPSEHRRALLSRWGEVRVDFTDTRRELADASADLERLRTSPRPTHGLVSAEERRQSLLADRAIQQDLAELNVNLTELKLHLLNVWQHSAGPLERLGTAIDDLISMADRPEKTTATDSAQDKEDSIASSAGAYANSVREFRQQWDRQFTALQQMEIDPQRAKVLDTFEQVRRGLGDFLYGAARRLTVLRVAVRKLGQDPVDSTKHHVYQSALTRAFQKTQNAHHQFEFAAASIETPENFRMDAALLSARGLRRRSKEMISIVDQRLERMAAERARRKHVRDVKNAEQRVAQVRSTVDQMVDQLLALQQDLNLKSQASEAFLRTAFKAEIATDRVRQIDADLDRSERELLELKTSRESAPSTDIEIISIDAESRPANLTQRLRAGGISGAIALICVLFGQWWMRRGAV